MTKSEYLLSLAENIKKLRKAQGMTQKELGEKIGSNHTAIVRMEKGKQDCRISTLFSVAKALNVEIADLVST